MSATFPDRVELTVQLVGSSFMGSSHAISHLDDCRLHARQRCQRVRTRSGARTTTRRAPAPTSTLTGCVVQAKTTDGGTVYVLSKAEGGSATMYVLGGSSRIRLVGEREQEG